MSGLEVAAVAAPDRRGDQTIPPDAERQFAARMGADTVGVASDDVAMVSHPDETVERIVTAASAAPSPETVEPRRLWEL